MILEATRPGFPRGTGHVGHGLPGNGISAPGAGELPCAPGLVSRRPGGFFGPGTVQNFSLENVGKSAAVFNPEKLNWLNGVYIRRERPEALAELLVPFLEKGA